MKKAITIRNLKTGEILEADPGYANRLICAGQAEIAEGEKAPAEAQEGGKNAAKDAGKPADKGKMKAPEKAGKKAK